MTELQSFADIACPYCGEWTSLALDSSAGAQQYIEDCQVCCRPMQVSVDWDEAGDVQLHVRAEDDA